MNELHVRAVSARNLLDKQTFGKQDPYCKITLGSQKFKTRVHDNGDRTPQWNEKFVFQVYDAQLDQLHLQIKDKGFASDVLIAECRLPVSMFTHGNVVDEWFPLNNNNKRAGEINLRVQLVGAGAAAGKHPHPQQQAYPAAVPYAQQHQTHPQGQPAYPPPPQAYQQTPYAQPVPGQQPYPPQQGYPVPAQAQAAGAPGYPPQQYPPQQYAAPAGHQAYPPPQQGMYPPPQAGAAYPPGYPQQPMYVAQPGMHPHPGMHPGMMPPPVMMGGPQVVYKVKNKDKHHKHGLFGKKKHHHGGDFAETALGVGAGVLGGMMLGDALESIFD